MASYRHNNQSQRQRASPGSVPADSPPVPERYTRRHAVWTVRYAVWYAVWYTLHGMVRGAVRGMVRGIVHGTVCGMVHGAVHGMVRGMVHGTIQQADAMADMIRDRGKGSRSTQPAPPPIAEHHTVQQYKEKNTVRYAE